ncbi:MAG: hypothetical protein BGP11_16920 [Rhodobacterales bacterium 65-51]|nr:MAG: hypothetical protein BGP11_16920 [Rhodobacterales bacterium 65-51]
MNRRRFLSIAAAALATPRGAQAAVWEGRGFGAAVSMRLEGADPARASLTFDRLVTEIERMEQVFSLHRDSALTRLNRDGRLAGPPPALLEVLALARQVHDLTGGAFDPTVQPLWQALATGGDQQAARAAIGLCRVQIDAREIRLAPGQALTLNGIAQGWAADRIAALLRAEGYGHALIDMGEMAITGLRADRTPWRVTIAGPEGQALREFALRGGAMATSSPRGTLIGAGQPHIVGPRAPLRPRWQTVSVTAPHAALADALSTAFCLMDRASITRTLAVCPGAEIALLA